MHLFVGLLLVIGMLDIASSEVPNVYDFCNALLNNDRDAGSPRPQLCGECPQGAPGKRGPEGRRGPPGPKGEKGEEGTCDELKTRMDELQNVLAIIIQKSPDALVDLCGLGIKTGAIPDTAITATSQWDDNWVGSKGRLDHPTHCWIARPSAVGEWIQIDLGKLTIITGVVIQGRPNVDQWVKSYKIACANNTDAQTRPMENGKEKIFPGNTDYDTKIVSFLPIPMSCRYVRIYPQSWNSHISMRMELLGENCLAYSP